MESADIVDIIPLPVERLMAIEWNAVAHANKHSLQFLYCRLFCVLGILWTIESVHFVIHNHYGKPCSTYQSLQVFFRIMDFCNVLRGFFFFIILVCKRSIWIQVKHFWFLKRSGSASACHQDGNEMRSMTIRRASTAF